MSKANKGKKHLEKSMIQKSLSSFIEIPTVALDEDGVFQLVYPHRFLNYKLSNWHTECNRLYKQNKIKVKLENKIKQIKGGY